MRLPLRVRILTTVVAVAVIPVTGFGILLALGGVVDPTSTLGRLLLFGIVLAAIGGILVGILLLGELTRPLRAMAEVVERVSAGDLGARIGIEGDDELARLAASHDRLAADLERRNRELTAILASVEAMSPQDGVPALVERAAGAAREAFGMIEAEIVLGDPAAVPGEAPIPGEARPIRAELRSGGETIGLLVGRVPATRRWERGDEDLLELYASEVGSALRNAELFARIEAQNERLLALDAAKDDFLRGVSHNLQTPLARIRAYADQLAGVGADRRPAIISEQAERLSRLVRQLLTVSRLESGVLRPHADVLALAPRVRRAWEALAPGEVEFALDDRADGWLAVADPDQLDQVLWALLDNAVAHGGGAPVRVTITAEPAAARVRLTIADRGPGVPDREREHLFRRFGRGTAPRTDGSGLGLYVSRRLCRAMDGDLVLEPAGAEGTGGAAFSVLLPGEPGSE